MNVIGQRMDLLAVGHAFGLIAVLSRRTRERIASVWPKYCYFLSAMLCFQYLLCVGFPPAACKGKKEKKRIEGLTGETAGNNEQL